MSDLLIILLATILVNNFVLVHFLGLCPLMGASRKLDTALGMGLATTFVLTLASVCSFSLNQWVLEPMGLEYLRLICFILITVSYTHLTLPTKA